MTRAVLMQTTLALLLAVSGCDNSDRGSAAQAPATASAMPKLCPSLLGAGLAKQCKVNGRDRLVEVTIDSFDDQAGRDACAEIAAKSAGQAAGLSGEWKLQVYSPYRNDKPLAECWLR